MSVDIRKPAANAGEKDDWIATEYSEQPIFDLPAGKYIAVVKLGIGESHPNIEVVAGKLTEVVINANIGFIATIAAGATSYEVKTGKKSLDGSNAWLNTSYDPALNLAVNAGAYLVKAFNGDAVIGEKLVEVKAGKRSEIAIP